MYKYSFRGLKDKIKSRKIIIPLIVIFQLILNTSVGAAWISPANSETIPYGVTVAGQNIGGLNRDQAVAFLNQTNLDTFVDKNIVIKNGRMEWRLPTLDYNFRYDNAKTVETILKEKPWAEGRPGILSLMKLQARKMDIPLEISWHEGRLDGLLETINQEMLLPARNASLDVVDGRILIVNGQAGEELDDESTTAKILHNIRFNDTDIVNVVKKFLAPEIVSDDLSTVDYILASFDTEMNTNNNRTNNIILASQLLDGTIIMPGDIFSFNQVIGERNPENGFKNAPVIIGGSVQQDVGGGICQVATTLYNAALLTGLEIVERSAHSIPVKYAPHGQDATVFYGQIDLKIKNNLSNPVMIHSTTVNNNLIISIYGNHQNKVNL